ncbi:MAG: penicillin-binding protein [Flavobacterium sp. BFFFF2]|nr:MAG: penicillin-binding protein [Flavobacterium sp. BFFFF2]
MIKTKHWLFFVAIWSTLTCQAQVGGKSVYQFLNLVTSPRQAALGGKILTLYDEDVNQAHFNPATIHDEMDNKLSANYASYFGDINYGTASYATTLSRSNTTLFFGMQYINYGTFEGYDASGQKTASFTGNEGALVVGSATQVEDLPVYLGVNLKFITSQLESYSSYGMGADIGALYKDVENGIYVAVTLRNWGYQLKTYSGINERLPTELMVGISQDLENMPLRWHLTLENLQQWDIAFSNPNRAQSSIDGSSTPEKVSFFNNALRHVIIGAELFPKRIFNLRIGYNFRRGEELSLEEQRNFSGICLGFGLRFNHIKFNYSYSRYTLASNTSLFGLNIDLQ